MAWLITVELESIGPLFLYHTFYILSVYEMQQFFDCRIRSRVFDMPNKPRACSTNKKKSFSRTCLTWQSKARGDFEKLNQRFGWKIMQGIVTRRSFASFIWDRWIPYGVQPMIFVILTIWIAFCFLSKWY